MFDSSSSSKESEISLPPKREPVVIPEELSFAEKLALKLGIKNVTEAMAYDDFMTNFTAEDHADVVKRDAIFWKEDFAQYSCELGKVSIIY